MTEENARRRSAAHEPLQGAPEDIPSLRTYKKDIESAVAGSSLSGIAAAQAQKRIPMELQTRSSRWKKFFWIAGAVLFLVGGVALSLLAYLATRPAQEQPSSAPASFFYTDESAEIVLPENATGPENLAALNGERVLVNLPLGSVAHFALVKETPAGREPLSTAEFFSRIEARAPSSLVRALREAFMFGVHAFDGNQSFLLFPVSAYDLAFAGMLEWEKNLPADLAPLFGTSAEDAGAAFTDVVYKNKDLRILATGRKNKLQYGFITPELLLITTSEFTFSEILTRLGSRRIE